MAFRKLKYHLLTEEELVLRFKEVQDTEVIGEIYKRFAHLMMGLSIKYLKQPEKAEDIVMQLFEKLPNLLNKSDVQYLKSWLYMVTKNECLMLLRKKTFKPLRLTTIYLKKNPTLLQKKRC